MTAKEYLSQLRLINKDIEKKLGYLEELNHFVENIKTMDYSEDRVQISRVQNASFTETIEKIIDLKINISSNIKRYVDLKNIIIKQIDSINIERYKDILYFRYIDFKRLDEIAIILNYSYDRVRHLHSEALMYFNKITNLSTQ